MCQHSLKKKDFNVFALIFLTIISGGIGNIISGYNRSLSLILNGILVSFKSFIITICANKFFEQNAILKVFLSYTAFGDIIPFLDDLLSLLAVLFLGIHGWNSKYCAEQIKNNLGKKRIGLQTANNRS